MQKLKEMYTRSRQAYIFGTKHPKYDQEEAAQVQPEQEFRNFIKTSKSLEREQERVNFLMAQNTEIISLLGSEQQCSLFPRKLGVIKLRSISPDRQPPSAPQASKTPNQSFLENSSKSLASKQGPRRSNAFKQHPLKTVVQLPQIDEVIIG